MLRSLRRKLRGDIRQNRGAFLAVWLTVMLGMSFYGSIYPAGRSLVDSFHKTYDDTSYLHYQLQFDPTDRDIVSRGNTIEGIEAVEGRIVIDTGIQLKADSPYRVTMRLISIPDDNTPQVSQYELIEGSNIQSEDDVLLLNTFAERHRIEVGDTLNIFLQNQEYELRVAGLVFNPEYIILGRSPESPFPAPSSFGVAWMHYSPLAEIASLEGQINEIAVHLSGTSSNRDAAREAQIYDELIATYSDLENMKIYTREQTASGGVVQAIINGNLPVSQFFSFLFLAGATIITSILLGRIVKSERRQIGTMRALGVKRQELIQHYLAFGLFIGVTGGLVGTLFGYLNSFWVSYIFIDRIVGGTLPGFVNTPNLPFMLAGFVVVVLGSTLAGLYPAWVDSATSPGLALRPTVPSNTNRISQIRLSFLPLSLRQSFRNLLRVPGRSISTALGVLLGAMMVFSAVALWDTTDRTFGDVMDAAHYDLRVDFEGLQDADSLSSEIQELEGVSQVQAALVAGVQINDDIQGYVLSLDEQNPFIDPILIEGEEAFSNSSQVWIGHNLADNEGLAVGDHITLRAFGQNQEVEIAGIVSTAWGYPVYVPRTLMASWLPSGRFVANTVYVQANDVEAARDAVARLSTVRAIELSEDFNADLNRYLEFFTVGTLIFGVFGVVLTLTMLFNAINASIKERQQELAVLLALGISGREIMQIVLFELLLMVMIGVIIGIPLGEYFGFWMSETYENDFYGVVKSVNMFSRLVGVVAVVIIAIIATLPGLRAVQKLDLGSVSKSQSV